MKIALLGFGTVASGVAKLIETNKELIKKRLGKDIEISLVYSRTHKNNCPYKQTNNFEDVLNSDVDVVCELMGGTTFAYECIKQALAKDKHVITANKALLAYYRYDIEKMLKPNQYFGYEASVAGGVPIIKIIKEGLSANKFNCIKGILNGTSNYILTKMQNEGISYEIALKQAQELGYAEANPSLDINGMDAAHKLTILASLAYGINVKPEDILVQGIDKISNDDFYFAKEFEFGIKLLAIAKQNEDKVEIRVHPTLIDKNHILASVNNSMNAILLNDNALGESLYYGAGAGSLETASAVLSDLMQIADNKTRKMLGYNELPKVNLVSINDISSKYYLRLCVDDKIGVLNKITSFMSNNEISIDSLMQRPSKNQTRTIFITTHIANEAKITKLLSELQTQEFVKGEINLIRIEE
ncbi:homoserine dehydrogenase [Campylobacter sp. RM5004]|uniref:homoserine dehydrogenase n=1 Tax=Campylobacter sp. RM5004 TaxID=1660078 RepID=UPI001EFA7FE8|nr:homoserine dehydrogenase [Campylobacter sp. RM5004]ULO02155.1 homoserine dehydrogenase [Campylobacter sp. RM5004]